MRKTLVFPGIFIVFLATSLLLEEAHSAQRVGEKIVYTIKLKGVSIGTAVFTQMEKAALGKEFLNFVTFETRVTGFQDTEKIYSDPHSCLPVRIERAIKGMSGREKIIEAYDQKRHTLTITKTTGKTTQKDIIKKETPIHNAIMLPFCVRDVAGLSSGWSIKAQLPNQSFTVKLSGTEHISVPAGKFKCYRFESEPKRFEIWITTDESHVPVKITGAAGLGYSLLMRGYSYKK